MPVGKIKPIHLLVLMGYTCLELWTGTKKLSFEPVSWSQYLLEDKPTMCMLFKVGLACDCLQC